MAESKLLPTYEIATTQKIIAVLWPSFLVAGVETIVFFTIFDPQFVFYNYDISRTGAYSIGFFLFWGFAVIPCILTTYFARPCKPCVGYKENLNKSEE